MQGSDRNTRGGGDKSVGVVLLEIAKLLALLCWKGLKALGRLILKGLRYLLRWMVMALLWLIDSIAWLARKIKAFWNDNNTQQKLRKIGRGLKKGAIAVLYALWVALIYIGKAIVWLCKKLFVGLIHLRTTLKTCGRWIARAATAFWHWLGRRRKAIRNWGARKRQQYKAFRKNKGFKGLLIDLRDAMKGSISSYIENDQQKDKANEDEGGAESRQPTDPDVLADDADEEPEEEVKGIRKIGRKIYQAMKRLVEV